MDRGVVGAIAGVDPERVGQRRHAACEATGHEPDGAGRGQEAPRSAAGEPTMLSKTACGRRRVSGESLQVVVCPRTRSPSGPKPRMTRPRRHRTGERAHRSGRLPAAVRRLVTEVVAAPIDEIPSWCLGLPVRPGAGACAPPATSPARRRRRAGHSLAASDLQPSCPATSSPDPSWLPPDAMSPACCLPTTQPCLCRYDTHTGRPAPAARTGARRRGETDPGCRSSGTFRPAAASSRSGVGHLLVELGRFGGVSRAGNPPVPRDTRRSEKEAAKLDEQVAEGRALREDAAAEQDVPDDRQPGSV